MGVEMLAGCILTPVMSMFSPGTSVFPLNYPFFHLSKQKIHILTS